MGPDSASEHSAVAPLQDAASAAPPAGRPSFFSRFALALPLRSRTRNIADFHVRPDEPHRKYTAGDHVQGAVVLNVLKPLRITHLTVTLHGYVRVYIKGSGGGGQGGRSGPNEAFFNPADVVRNSDKTRQYGHGYVSLFQDEQVLSADGRIESGRYEFRFDLVFASGKLPSSIDFERGTISYMVTATLTRPTAISPMSTCERKIYLTEKIDIGRLAAPRPRTIFLEPISKKPRTRKAAAERQQRGLATGGNGSSDGAQDQGSDPDSNRALENSTEGSLSVVGDDLSQDTAGSRSPVQSDMRSTSEDSAISCSTGRRERASDANPAGDVAASIDLSSGGRTSNPDDRTITAKIEVLKGGCLAGDNIPVKITVQHIRRIKSMYGVIVTLYRQGRIDSSPPASLFKDLSEESQRKLEKEAFFPKSRTGLGGLSLSSAGSCSVFRKDLSQSFSPLIINPETLTASVTSVVRVPEDVFPTIRGIPGEMMSFKYYVEVVVDLGGKLANQLQGGNSSTSRAGPTVSAGSMKSNPYEMATAMTPCFGSGIVDTDRLRREKGVISIHSEVTVGTWDSSRRGRAASKTGPSIYDHLETQPEAHWSGAEGDLGHLAHTSELESMSNRSRSRHAGHSDREPYDGSQQTPQIPSHHQQTAEEPCWTLPLDEVPAAPLYAPPPPISDERRLSEKERVRHAEERLLPSQPSGLSTGSWAVSAGPSTVYGTSAVEPGPAANCPDAPGFLSASRQPLVPPASHPSEIVEVTTARMLEQVSFGTEDKAELERQRLLAEASAPPDFPEDYEGAIAETSAPSDAALDELQPSAPVLTEDDEYGVHHSYRLVTGGPPSSGHDLGPGGPQNRGEALPRYER